MADKGPRDWRSKPKGTSKPRATGERWRGSKGKVRDQADRSRKRSRFTKILLGLVVSLGLLAGLLWAVIDTKPRTPFVAVAVTSYRWPLPPNAWAQEDQVGYELLDGKTIDLFNGSDRFNSDHEVAWVEFPDELKKATAGRRSLFSFGSSAAVLYISMHGAVNDAGEPCLIPSGTQVPRLQENWLKLSDLLSTIGSSIDDDVKKLLVLDCSRMTYNWQLGMLYNRFNETLESAVRDSKVPNLVVLSASEPGQVAWSSPALGGSVFGYYFKRGLFGEADTNRDDDVSLKELNQYVRAQVQQWAAENRADTQTPWLTSGESEDFIVAHAPDIKLPLPAKVTLSETAANQIRKLWETALELRRKDDADARHPEKLNNYWLLLRHLEQVVQSGAAYTQYADDIKRQLSELENEIRKTRKRRLETYSVPLAKRFGAARTGESVDLDAQIAEKLDADEVDYELKEQGTYLETAEAVWRLFRDKPEQQRLAHLLRFLEDSKRSSAPHLVEMQLLRLFNRYLPAASWNPNLLQRALDSRRELEESVVPRDWRLSYWVKPSLDQADAHGRMAEDYLYQGGQNATSEANGQWRQSGEQIKKATGVANEISEILQLRDEVWLEVPFLAEWAAARPIPNERGEVVERMGLVVKLIDQNRKLSNLVNQELHQQSPDVANVSEIAKLVRDDFKILKDAFKSEYEGLKGSDQPTLRRIQDALLVPIIPPTLRAALSKRVRAIDSASRGDTVETEAVVPVASDAELNRVAGWAVHPAIALLGPILKDLPNAAEIEDKLTLIGLLEKAFRTGLAAVPARMASLEALAQEKLVKGDAITAVRGDLAEAEIALRSCSAVLGSRFASSAMDEIAELDLGNFMLWMAQRANREFLGDPSEVTKAYFERLVTGYLMAADDQRKYSRTKEGLQIASELKKSKEAAKKAFVLATKSIPPWDKDQKWLDFPLQVTQTMDLSSGVATFILYGDGTEVPHYDESLSPIRRQIPTTNPTPYKLPQTKIRPGDITGKDLEAVVFFRGHLWTRQVNYADENLPLIALKKPTPPLPLVRVKGSRRNEGAVVIILDCSYSMILPENVPRDQNRMAQAKRALIAIMRDLAKEGTYQVGVRFFGHRLWHRGGSGNDNDQYMSMWPPEQTDLQLGNDTERVLPVKPFNRGSKSEVERRLGLIRPMGVTPVFYATRQAIEKDLGQSNAAVKSVIVISDGRSVKDLDSRDNVIASAKKGRVRIHTVGFYLSETEQASVDLKKLADDTGGIFRVASSEQDLTSVLNEAIGPESFYVEQPGRRTKDNYLNQFVEIDKGEAKVWIDSRSGSADKKIQVYGGEAIELSIKRVAGGDLKLVHERYDDEIRWPIPNSDTGPVYGPPPEEHPYFIGIHTPRWLDDGQLQFEISLQNFDPSELVERPREAWIRIVPKKDDGTLMIEKAFTCYDLRLLNGKPVPVLVASLSNWPREAKKADVELWWKSVRTIRNEGTWNVADLLGKTAPLDPSPPGAEIAVEVQPHLNGYRILVTERNDTPIDDGLKLKVDLDPPADVVKRRFDVENGIVRHTFDIDDARPSDLQKYLLTVTRFLDIKENAVYLEPQEVEIEAPPLSLGP